MPRVKRGKTASKKRKNLLKQAKGFRWGRKSKYKAAKEALMKAWSYKYRDRRAKKREMRRLWNNKINMACREHNTTYRDFIKKLKEKDIALDRKILADLVQNHSPVFEKIVEETKK